MNFTIDDIMKALKSLTRSKLADNPNWKTEAQGHLVDLQSEGGSVYRFLPVEQQDGRVVRQALELAVERIDKLKRPEGVALRMWVERLGEAAKRLETIHADYDLPIPQILGAIKNRTARAISIWGVYEQVCYFLEVQTMKTGRYHYVVDVFLEGGAEEEIEMDGMEDMDDEDGEELEVERKVGVVALVTVDNIPHVARFEVEGNEVVFKEMTPLDLGKSTQQRTYHVEQPDGRYRFVRIAAASVLNRVNEIDSSSLFSNIQRRWEDAGKPELTLDFHHMGEKARLGGIDFVASHENTLVVSWLFDNTPYGQAAERTLLESPDYWGLSIEFQPLDGELVYIDDQSVPVYTDGYLVRTALCAETKAASYFTGVRRMNMAIKDDLQALLKDEQLVDDFLSNLQRVNEAVVKSGKYRTAVTDTQAGEQEADTESAQTQAEAVADVATPELELTDELLDVVVERLASNATLQAAITDAVAQATAQVLRTVEEKQQAAIGELNGKVATITTAVEAIGRAEAEKKQEWLADIPTRQTAAQRVSYRPSATTLATAQDTPKQNGNYAEQANKALQGIPVPAGY